MSRPEVIPSRAEYSTPERLPAARTFRDEHRQIVETSDDETLLRIYRHIAIVIVDEIKRHEARMHGH